MRADPVGRVAQDPVVGVDGRRDHLQLPGDLLGDLVRLLQHGRVAGQRLGRDLQVGAERFQNPLGDRQAPLTDDPQRRRLQPGLDGRHPANGCVAQLGLSGAHHPSERRGEQPADCWAK